MTAFVLLLPSAEGKQAGGNPFAPDMFDYRASNTFNYFSELNPLRRQVIQHLHQALDDGTDLEKLFGVKGKTLEEAIQVNREVMHSPLMAALDRYSPGVLYQAMAFSSLPTGAQRRLLENGVIFSGMFGLLRPDDLIPNYRLRMDATLPGLGKVSRFWRPHLSPVLNKLVENTVVWNLLPAAHQAAWEDAHTYREMIQIRFFWEKDGQRLPVSHGVKSLRGSLANFIVRESATDVAHLEEWLHPEGFRVDAEASTWDEDTRTRTLVMVASR